MTVGASPTMATDGGPAFPRPMSVDSDTATIVASQQGMSLRDWFAGQALAGLLAADTAGSVSSDMGEVTARYAGVAYRLANAMLEARGGEESA